MFNTPRSSLRPSSLRGGHSARGRPSTVRPPASGQERANLLDNYNEISKRLHLHNKADLKKLDKGARQPPGRDPSPQSDDRALNRHRNSCNAIPHAQLFGVEQRPLRIS